MTTVASHIISPTVVYSTVYSGADEIKHQSFASLAFVRGIHRNRNKGPVTRKMFPFDDFIMNEAQLVSYVQTRCDRMAFKKDWFLVLSNFSNQFRSYSIIQ